MKNLWDEYSALEPVFMCKCGSQCDNYNLMDDRDQRKRLLQFPMSLNDSFAAARGQILMMNPLPTISQAYALVKQGERQKLGAVSVPFIRNVKTNGQQSFASKNNGQGEKKQSL
ncbi:hypothetical protein DCAR_0933974 [Daucus carota subsp. sativus]|uniref:Uncharacterized protein n=1 Tax=Daucus carota subsp. sativus TaxID=79200 RepID=A0AAF0XUY8_DAUCS|nr:hypothetical protein DCAR_0933974 [Daucus carota subsp. sativus]